MSLVDDLYDHYKDLVERGEMAPEDVPTARVMAHEWCVSTGPTAKARKRLMADGWAVSVARETRELGLIDKFDWARFLDMVNPADENGCTLWNAAVGGGYGQFNLNNRHAPAHRVAYEYLVGPIPDGLELDHVWERGCRSVLCVNVEHLEPVTRAENARRRDAARREASVTALRGGVAQS